VLWELKVADLWNQAQPSPVFTDQELVRLVTANPGQALSGVWPHPVGTIQPGALADLVVVSRRHADPYRNLIQATEPDIRLVLVGGAPRYGTRPLMTAAGATSATQIPGRAADARHRLRRPAITWAKVLAELERVRTNPQQAVQRAVAALETIATAGPTADDAPFVLLPDMPTPESDSPTATLEVLAPVVVPSPQPLTTGRAWFDAVDANPFHRGLLSGLRDYA
jgi:5-methylthioadenosine/S-adenosylhomocysteine deaminase